MNGLTENNFGVIRLALAALVILAHSPEIIDGDRSREIATSIWGTVTFGTVAVDGFFIVSGYLITASYMNSSGFWAYMWKRALRIYPAFLVAFALCVFVFGPLGGMNSLTAGEAIKNTLKAFILAEPSLTGVFPTLRYPVINGAMWTIAYEFRCYLLVGLLGVLGLLRFRLGILVVGLCLLTLNGFGLVPTFSIRGLGDVLGEASLTARLFGVFLLGASFYLYRDTLRYRGWMAGACAFALVGILFIDQLAEIGIATLGAYALFWLAFSTPVVPLRHDISYGLYLYAWPISSLLVYYWITPDPWLNAGATVALASIFGLASWLLIERPALRFKGHLPKPMRQRQPS